MRWFFLLCSVMLTTVWLLPEAVVAGDDERITPVEAVDPQTYAQSLEDSLRAVEWYTNEAVRKALHAEAEGDMANARLFGDKAIESDKKARDLRLKTANAWLAVNDSENAQAVWFRAAGMAEERALMLAKRIPTLAAQWQSVSKTPSAPSAPSAAGHVAVDHEQEVIYLQALFFTAQHWAVAADFYNRAGEQEAAEKARVELQMLLPRLVANDRLNALGDDLRLKDTYSQVQGWQAGRLP